MDEKQIMKLPEQGSGQHSLRAMFKQYLQASTAPEKLAWESITMRNGLPHNWIYDLFQDTTGRIWVGTWGGGLAVYETNRWRVYTRKDGLHSNEVTCIREDKAGRIWIATDNGLNVMDGEHIADAGLTGKSLLNITFDREGNLWAGCWRAALSGGGLYKYDHHAWTCLSTRQDLPGLEILKVFLDSRGRIWVGTYEQGIGAGAGCFDGNHWKNYSTRDGLIDDCVYSMFEDPAGNMWFGTTGGISVFDGKQWHSMTSKNGLVDDRVYCMLIDSKKKMWFGTEGGVSHFDGNAWTSYTKRDGLVENLVRTIVENRDGSLWFGTYPYTVGQGGISICRYQAQKSLPDSMLDILPEPPKPRQLPAGSDKEY